MYHVMHRVEFDVFTLHSTHNTREEAIRASLQLSKTNVRTYYIFYEVGITVATIVADFEESN